MTTTLIERTDLDGAAKPCSEGWFAATPAGEVILMPPGAELNDGLVDAGYRAAHQAEVDTLPTEPGARKTTKPKPSRFARLDEIKPWDEREVVARNADAEGRLAEAVAIRGGRA